MGFKMINSLYVKETIQPLRDVITPVMHGTKHIINGLAKSHDAKTAETYLTLGANTSIKSQEILFDTGVKAIFSEKRTPNGIFRVFEHGGDSKVSVAYNKDGDFLAFKAKGHKFVVNADDTVKENFVMRNDEHPSRKTFEIERTKDILNSLLPKFFKF